MLIHTLIHYLLQPAWQLAWPLDTHHRCLFGTELGRFSPCSWAWSPVVGVSWSKRMDDRWHLGWGSSSQLPNWMVFSVFFFKICEPLKLKLLKRPVVFSTAVQLLVESLWVINLCPWICPSWSSAQRPSWADRSRYQKYLISWRSL